MLLNIVCFRRVCVSTRERLFYRLICRVSLYTLCYQATLTRKTNATIQMHDRVRSVLHRAEIIYISQQQRKEKKWKAGAVDNIAILS